MANAQVEKLKALGLRHGEKAVVGLAALLCFLFLIMAVLKPTIQITPEQVNKDADAARSSLERHQEPADVLSKIEQDGIKEAHFVAIVEAQQGSGLKADNYKVARSWVTPEPGAGLIRDTPELIAPTELYAYPGRGGALIFALDDEGKRIAEDPNAKKADETTVKRRSRKRRRRSSGGSSAMMAGSAEMMGGMPTNPAQMTEEQKKKIALEERKLKAKMAGKVEEETKTAEAPTHEGGPYKEVTKGLRWVAITGVLDHKKLRDNYQAALKNPTIAHPNYKQLGVQRQVKLSDGTWSEWEDIDLDENRKITDNLPEEEEELTPDTVRLTALVDPLPFLKAGYWERVHVASLVPKEKREIDKSQIAAQMGPGMMGGGSSSAGAQEQMMAQSAMMMSSSSSMGSGSAMMMGSMAGSGDTINFPTTEAEKVMIRSLDFTVEPDTTYRFHVRIVVYNPNFKREDVSPGTDTKSPELFGPWSEPTNEVTMPADITAYTMQKFPSGPGSKRTDLVSFQVVKWDHTDGVTVYRNMEYGPGQIVGETLSTKIPSSEGTGAKNRPIDYNSHQLMLDEYGGEQPLSQVGVGGKLDVPALSLLLRRDGTVMVRNETFDKTDPVRKDIFDNYKREIEESDKARENSNGMMNSGMR